MAWTDERIELLKKLFDEGLSNELIAQRMGGVTRNAVLGKIHRLGWAGTRARPHKPLVKKGSSGTGWRGPKKPAPKKPQAPRLVKRQTAYQQLLASDAEPFVPTAEELVIPIGERKTLQDLNDGDCRWPIGDPQNSDFHFCAKAKVIGLSWCEHHARRAFKPPVPATQSAAGGHFRFGGHPGSGAPRMPASDKPRETEDVS